MTVLAGSEPLASIGVAKVHVLHPGDVAVGRRGDRLETLLGSCVAIILTDPRRTVGAMCHIVHSGDAARQPTTGNAHAAPALRSMFTLLEKQGIAPTLCEAYVYGGGNMFPTVFSHTHVGQRNSEWALQALMRHGIHLVDQDVGGATYRRLSWTVGSEAPRIDAVAV